MIARVERSVSPEYNPFDIGIDHTPLPVYRAAGTKEIDFDGLLSPPLKLHEDLAGGCGGQLWPAGMVLSKYMLREHREDMENGTVYAFLIFRLFTLFSIFMVRSRACKASADTNTVWSWAQEEDLSGSRSLLAAKPNHHFTSQINWRCSN